mmetsp:Transcript_35080/g.85996  ORF Transcript_35080/g.85996 Transcript_35080/m.85996 type:complete len:609 (-) Transcript_35080:77-1903(-)
MVDAVGGTSRVLLTALNDASPPQHPSEDLAEAQQGTGAEELPSAPLIPAVQGVPAVTEEEEEEAEITMEVGRRIMEGDRDGAAAAERGGEVGTSPHSEAACTPRRWQSWGVLRGWRQRIYLHKRMEQLLKPVPITYPQVYRWLQKAKRAALAAGKAPAAEPAAVGGPAAAAAAAAPGDSDSDDDKPIALPGGATRDGKKKRGKNKPKTAAAGAVEVATVVVRPAFGSSVNSLDASASVLDDEIADLADAVRTEEDEESGGDALSSHPLGEEDDVDDDDDDDDEFDPLTAADAAETDAYAADAAETDAGDAEAPLAVMYDKVLTAAGDCGFAREQVEDEWNWFEVMGTNKAAWSFQPPDVQPEEAPGDTGDALLSPPPGAGAGAGGAGPGTAGAGGVGRAGAGAGGAGAGSEAGGAASEAGLGVGGAGSSGGRSSRHLRPRPAAAPPPSSPKRWMPLFSWTCDVAVVNSFAVWRSEVPLAARKGRAGERVHFQKELVRGLLGLGRGGVNEHKQEATASQVASKRTSAAAGFTVVDAVATKVPRAFFNHFDANEDPTGKKLDCAVCSRKEVNAKGVLIRYKSKFSCAHPACNGTRLHLGPCWAAWHKANF